MTLRDRLHSLTKSREDRYLFGVCGGLAEWTQTPSWIWRLGLVCLIIFYGTGLLAYVLLAIFMPEADANT